MGFLLFFYIWRRWSQVKMEEMSFQVSLDDYQGLSVPDWGVGRLSTSQERERKHSGKWFCAWHHEASLTHRSQASGGRADPRLLGALRKTVCVGGMNERMKRIWPSRIALAKSARSCLFCGSLCFQLVFLVSSKRLYYIHVTRFDRFLRRKGDSTALQ